MIASVDWGGIRCRGSPSGPFWPPQPINFALRGGAGGAYAGSPISGRGILRGHIIRNTYSTRTASPMCFTAWFLLALSLDVSALDVSLEACARGRPGVALG